MEFEYKVLEYFKDFKLLSKKFDDFISLLHKIFWRLAKVKENVYSIKIFFDILVVGISSVTLKAA